MKRRKTLLSVAHEFLAALPYLFKHRPVQLMFTGILVIAIFLPIFDYYNFPDLAIIILCLIGALISVLGVVDLFEEDGEDKHGKIMQKLELIEKELREIKDRLEKIEGYL